LQRLKLKCDEPFSNFAWNHNARRYAADMSHHFRMVSQMEVFHELHQDGIKAGAYTRPRFSSI
jgi:hypothetical protein